MKISCAAIAGHFLTLAQSIVATVRTARRICRLALVATICSVTTVRIVRGSVLRVKRRSVPRLECLERAEQCGACDGLICSDCGDLEFCRGCNTLFCKVHHRLVDCQACKTRHCRACGHKKRCQLCDSSCYEGCVCGGKNPEAKRAKQAIVSR